MTRAMLKALIWLSDHGGDGVIDRYGRIVAGGETSPQSPTWLRLMTHGLITGDGINRIRITAKGEDVLEEGI